MRLFLALPLPPKLSLRLKEVQAELEGIDWRVTWTPPEKLHLTLHFLGETPENLLTDLHHDLGALMHSRRPFDLRLGGLGSFPNWQDPRVLWTAVEDPAAKLSELFESTFKALKAYRFFNLKKEFTPHITLGRVRELKPNWDPTRLTALLPQWDKLGRLPVESLTLFQSVNGQYEALQEYRALSSGNPK